MNIMYNSKEAVDRVIKYLKNNQYDFTINKTTDNNWIITIKM